MKTRTRFLLCLISFLSLAAANVARAAPREIVLNFVPAKVAVNFTLGASLHTVHGSFALKSGAVRFDPASGKLSGEIVVDARSGQSENEGRDRKMHKEILESERYPDIVFRPDRVQGQISAAGASTLQVHGIFTIHGADHEIVIPVRVEMPPGRWVASAHFTIPYISWGLRNPSTFILRVDKSVDIDVLAAGEIP